MGENGEDKPSEAEQAVAEVMAQAQSLKYVLHVEYDPATKQIQANGPTDLVLAMGMLEMAKASMIRNMQARPSPIVGASMIPPPFARGRRG